MDVREKLAEICFHEFCMVVGDSPCGCDGCPYGKYGSDDGECYEEYKNDKLTKLEKAGVTVQEWTSVNDPPKKDGKYLVHKLIFGRVSTMSVLGFAKDGEKVSKYDLHGEKNVWYEYDSEVGYFSVDSVTHWMPLPEPPKGE